MGTRKTQRKSFTIYYQKVWSSFSQRKIDDDLLDCAQSYTVFKFQPEIGAFSACCDADLINYDHESFLELGAGYFDKHPDLVQRKLDLRNNIKNKQCSQCWKKEDQGIKSMRQTLAPTDSMLNHQNPYLLPLSSFVSVF